MSADEQERIAERMRLRLAKAYGVQAKPPHLTLRLAALSNWLTAGGQHDRAAAVNEAMSIIQRCEYECGAAEQRG